MSVSETVTPGASGISVKVSGPFFEKDPAKTFRENVRVMLEAMAAEAQADVRDNTPIGSPPDPHPGFTQAGIFGRVKSLTGKPWALTMVVSQQHVFPWGGQGSIRTTLRHGRISTGQKQYRGGKLEAKLHMFRSAAQRLRSSRAVNKAELMKGLE